MIDDNFFAKQLEQVDVLKAFSLALTGNERDLLDINKERLAEGETVEGLGMGEYSPMWAEYKGRYSPIDLKDTGEYQAGMYLVVGRDETAIRSRDDKETKLNEYTKKKSKGGSPLGLSKRDVPKVQQIIMDDFRSNFKNDLF